MFRPLTLFTLVLAFSVVVMGAFVRISDAGLGCPDWPGCYGRMIVEEPAIAEALRERPFDAAKAWLEMGHRYLAGILGVFVLILAGLALRLRERRGRAVALGFGILALVILQAVLGLWAVQYRVMPVVVTAHLLAGFLTLALLYRLYASSGPEIMPLAGVGGLLGWSRLALVVLLGQVALGGWVSSNYAALACPDFPACHGSLWPAADYGQGFRLWWGAEVDYQGGVLSPAARIAVHFTHRLGAMAAFLVLSILALGVTSNPKVPRLSKAGLLLSFLLLVEIGLGIALVLLRLPVVVALAHHTVAALLLLNLVHIHFFLSRPLRPEAGRVTVPELPAAVPEVALPPPVVEVPVPPTPEGLFVRLKTQLGKTRGGLTGFLSSLPLGRKTIDQDLLDDIEAQLLMADIGVTATRDIVAHLTDSLERHELDDVVVLRAKLRDYLYEILEPVSAPLRIDEETRPFVILVVGVNGVGKTTTIGKLARRFQNEGHSVMLAAGDTFRAAAVEQLQTWGERNQVPVIAQHTGADSASVIYDAVQAAQARGIDVLIADTAGRLHTKSNLMEELSKIKRIIARLDATAPHEVLLVLDAGTGQNAISQARLFNEAIGLTGIALTKLDGTAKGGVIFALARQFGIPIRYVGIGEGIDDLQDFEARRFIEALFAE